MCHKNPCASKTVISQDLCNSDLKKLEKIINMKYEIMVALA